MYPRRDETGTHLEVPSGKALDLNGVQLCVIEETVDHAQFTDGGGAVGTYDLTKIIPIGAHFIGADVLHAVGFAGDVSAALTIGDGTDVDRYNAGTLNVFATLPNGVAGGVPSGVLYHAAAKTVKLTITTNADWTSVGAGEVTVRLYYLK